MERLALIARLKPGTEARAEESIAIGPPLDPQETGSVRHNRWIAPEKFFREVDVPA
jgi:hypothetical protein